MALTHKAALTVVASGLTAFLWTTNPNFEARDVLNPHNVFQKYDFGRKYPLSGMVYISSYTAMLGSLACVGYLAARGKFKE